jgi:hypothetical protein
MGTAIPDSGDEDKIFFSDVIVGFLSVMGYLPSLFVWDHFNRKEKPSPIDECYIREIGRITYGLPTKKFISVYVSFNYLDRD